MDTESLIAILPSFILVGIISMLYYRRRFDAFVIKPYQQGVVFKKGVFHKIIGPGSYKLSPAKYRVDIMDMREEAFSFNQQLMTEDNISFTGAFSVKFQVSDPYKAILASQNFKINLLEDLRSLLIHEATLRDIAYITSRTRDFSEEIKHAAQIEVDKLGVKLLKFEIIDIILPPEIRQIISQTTNKKLH